LKLLVWPVFLVVLLWTLTVLFYPWALHIGGRSTPFLYWHGVGTVVSKDGKAYPLYVSFWPDEPKGYGGGNLTGTARLCIAPGNVERLDVEGEIHGGYASDRNSRLEFRLVEYRKPFSSGPDNRGYFDVSGTWHGPELVMDHPGEEGIRLKSGPFIDNATVTLRWARYPEFEAACRSVGE
jgi:hypothetical protein